MPVGSRALEILFALLEKPGEVVGHKALNARVWPNIYVSEATLRVQIRALRKALDDGVDGARYITNIPGRGYCFVGQVEGLKTVPASAREDQPVRLDAAPVGYPTNLPRRLDRLIGRATEVAELDVLVAQNRLVTIAGAGGVGKSRLCLDIGWRVSARHPDGVWLIDLAPLSHEPLVAYTVATAIGAKIHNELTAIEIIGAAIGKRRMLLILDNCEHLSGAVAEIIEFLLQRCADLFFLATSQGTIGIASERIYRLSPLATPPVGDPNVLNFGAVELFVERAKESDRRFLLDSDAAKTVASICRRLDGIPLALEMAAARLPLLGLEGLSAGLDKRLRMLTADLPIGVGRHSTLRTMAEWSHSLLDEETQVVFRRLAIFPGSFSLEAAVAVAGGPQADYWDTVDQFGRLVNKSLVALEPSSPPRYRLLETLRLFALERLAESHEERLAGERHAAHFQHVLESVVSDLERCSEELCLAKYGVEIGNVRAALDWALAEPDRAEFALGLAGCAGLLWECLGLYSEAREYFERVLPLAGEASRRRDVARLWLQSAIALRYVDSPRAKALLERCISLCLDIDEPLILASARARLGAILTTLSQLDEAVELLTAAQKTFLTENYPISEIGCIINLGIISMQRKDFERAEQLYKRGLSIARTIRRFSHISLMLSFLSGLAFARGDLERATDLAQQSVDVLKANNSRLDLGARLSSLAIFLMWGGRLSQARTTLAEALAVQRLDGGAPMLSTLQAGALLLVFEQRPVDAAQLIGFVDRAYALMGATRQPAEQRIQFALMAMLNERLSSEEIVSCAASGADWIEDQAVDFLLGQRDLAAADLGIGGPRR